MADENTVQEIEEGKGEKKSDFLKMVLIGLVVFVIAIGTSYLLLQRMIQPLLPEYQNVQRSVTVGNLVNVGEFTTNLRDSGFVKMEVTVEVAGEDDKTLQQVENSIPIIRDTVINTIASKSRADLSSSNRDNLKEEFKQQINYRLGSELIYAIYFEQVVVQ